MGSSSTQAVMEGHQVWKVMAMGPGIGARVTAVVLLGMKSL